MAWRQIVRACWPAGRRRDIDDRAALKARQSADSSNRQAQLDFRKNACLRAEADDVAGRLKAHNEANRYDDFLRRVVQGCD